MAARTSGRRGRVPGRLGGLRRGHPPCPADSGLRKRRVFSLLPHDRDAEPDGLYRAEAPGEAVEPRTIRPGQVGRRTARSQRGTGATVASIDSSAPPVPPVPAARRTGVERRAGPTGTGQP
ncbi:DUF6009 family protein [Streptomyces cyaneofuscatus]|uniref:DUF6009 family protein n=1 Tax=Streptomyces cyaneofuscatus TaxID=66883 RepID=UPI0037B20A4F